MLEQLDDTDWESLQHAYGPAHDVPALLRQLAAVEDVEQLEEIADVLYGNLFHQGTRYEATVHAVPFLYEILRGTDNDQLAAWLIGYLHGLAVGYAPDAFPERADPTGCEAFVASCDETALKRRAASIEELDLAGLDQLFGETSAYWGSRCYLAVEAGLADVLPSLSSDDDERAVAALVMVADFPRRAPASAPLLRRLVREGDPGLRGPALLGLALLEQDPTQELALLAADDEVQTRLYVAAAAALSGAPHVNDGVVERLSMALGPLGQEPCPFANTLGALVAGALSALPEAYRPRAALAIARAHVDADDDARLQMTPKLLHLAFSRRPPASASELTPTERMAVETCLEHGGWRWGNYGILMREWGLPSSRDALRTWLAGANPTK